MTTDAAARSRLLARLSVLRWRAIAVTVVVVAFFCSWWVLGPPVTRPDQLLWIIVIVLVASVDRALSIPRILLDWLPLFVVLYLYDYTRGWATYLGIPTHYRWALDADRFLFHGTVPSAWLQQHFYDPYAVHWWDRVAALVYLSHFVASLALATALYITSRPRWAAYMRRFLLLTVAGLTTYVFFPAAPPWVAHEKGLLPGVLPIKFRAIASLHLAPTQHWLVVGEAHTNDVAAIPSLHAGFSMLVALVLISYGARPWRRLWILAYPLAMALEVVYAGDHYVVDVLLGWAYAGLAMVACSAWERMRARGRAAPPGPGERVDEVEPAAS